MPIIPGWDGLALRVTKMDTTGRVWQVPPVKLVAVAVGFAQVGIGGQTGYSYIPDPGYVMEASSLYLSFPKPPAATSGTHRLTLRHGITMGLILDATANWNQDIHLEALNWRTAGMPVAYPTSETAIALALQNLRIDENYELRIEYYNNTDRASSVSLTFEMMFLRREVQTA